MFHPPAKFFCFRKQLFYPLATQTAHESFWRFVGVGLSKFFMYRSRQRIKRSLTCFIQQRKSLVLFSLTGMWLPKLLMPRPIRWQEQAEARPAAGICPKRCSPVWDASCPGSANRQLLASCLLLAASGQQFALLNAWNQCFWRGVSTIRAGAFPIQQQNRAAAFSQAAALSICSSVQGTQTHEICALWRI